MDAVTEVLIDRSHDADIFVRLVIVSLVAHATLISAFMLAGRFAPPAPHEPVMVISLAGAPGPVQGHNPTSAKPVQQTVPDAVKPKTDAPPALAKPEMIEPVKVAKVQPKAEAKPDKLEPQQQLHSRTPTTGPEVKKGTARIETGGAETKFGGLATGGAGAPGAYTDYADFCCPEYLNTIRQLVYDNWQPHQGQQVSNEITITIQRDGSITDVRITKGASPMLDLASQRAVAVTRRLPALPAAFTRNQLTIHLGFDYQR
jgi:outer membrane biosynthesis protein TonB